MICLITVAVDGSLTAQTAAISVSAGSVAPNGFVSLNVNLQAGGGAQPVAVQWDTIYSTGDLAPVAGAYYLTGEAANASGKQASCNIVAAGDIRCLIVGFDTFEISDGVLATLFLQIAPGTGAISTFVNLTGAMGVDSSTNLMILTASGATVNISNAIPLSAQTPVIFSLVNAASYADEGGCSPGAAATLFGANLAPSTQSAGAGSLPTELNGVRVSANGAYLPLFYVSEFQLNFQCPVLAPGDALVVIVENAAGSSAPFASKILCAAPGIFSLYGTGGGQGAILIANSPNIAMQHVDGMPSQPARPGDFVSIYATGLGPVNLPVPAGQPAPLDPLAKTDAPIQVLIGGLNAAVQFAGLAPGSVALYQVNAKVPGTAVAENIVPVQISVNLPDGSVAKSNVVTIGTKAN